jgi:hypothetical protein
LQKRKENAKANRIDYHLEPLTNEEELYIAALQLDVPAAFESWSQSVINNEISHDTQNAGMQRFIDKLTAEEKKKLENFKKKQEVELQNLRKNPEEDLDNVTRKQGKDLHNFTRNLLYDLEVTTCGMEMDTLLILPSSRLIIGKN